MPGLSRIGVLTGGGDAPGLNAVIRAVVKTAIVDFGWEVVGIEDGFEGLLDFSRHRRLELADVRGLLPRGGTILGTASRGHFVVRYENGRVIVDEGVFSRALDNMREKLRIDALVVIGGEGSQRIGYALATRGAAVIGVPKTIDNDLLGTELTFGFDTALDIATEAIDRLHTTAESHGRVLLVEVMGRNVGWIALQSGIAGGADVILIPEIPFHIEKAAKKIRDREASGRRFSIIVVAEGATPSGGGAVYREVGGPDRPARLGGVGELVAEQLSVLTLKECRTVVLGHLQRGGTPTAFDRMLATCYGSAAVRALAEGNRRHMVSYRCSEVVTVPLEECIHDIKVIPPDHHLIRVARDMRISFAGEDD